MTDMEDEIQKMEDRQVPKGRIDIIGCGRLGLRIAINLMQVHRGGPEIIGALMDRKYPEETLSSHYMEPKSVNRNLISSSDCAPMTKASEKSKATPNTSMTTIWI